MTLKGLSPSPPESIHDDNRVFKEAFMRGGDEPASLLKKEWLYAQSIVI